MSLQEHLSKLGIPSPTETADPPPSTPSAEIGEILRGVYTRDLGNVDVLYETFVTLETWCARLDHELAKHGVRAVISNDKLSEFPDHRIRHYGIDGKPLETPCDHALVDVTIEGDRLQCRTCQKHVSPIWWLSKFASTLKRGANWVTHIRNEKRKLHDEIEELKRQRDNLKAAVRRQTKK